MQCVNDSVWIYLQICVSLGLNFLPVTFNIYKRLCFRNFNKGLFNELSHRFKGFFYRPLFSKQSFVINANDKLREHDKLFAIVARFISDSHLHNCSPSLQFSDDANKIDYESLTFSLRPKKNQKHWTLVRKDFLSWAWIELFHGNVRRD